VLIVSNDANNRAAKTVTVLPITSKVSRVYPFEILLSPKESGLPKPSKAQAQQIRAISKERLRGGSLGRLNAVLMRKAGDAIRLHLDL
jgi:mRNA interferase MazF